MRSLALVSVVTLCFVAAAPVAFATTINFDSQAALAPSSFNGVTNSPLTIGMATFTGGELLNNETLSVDLTGVYATTNLFGFSGVYTNPLAITFSGAVSGFSLLLTNNSAGSFTVSDNVGDSQNFVLALNSKQTFTLAGNNITSVNISQLGGGNFDYAIDDVTFNNASTITPEPSGIVLLGTGLLGIATTARRNSV